MGEARGTEPGAPDAPAPRLRPTPDTARYDPSPGARGSGPRGAAHLQGRGQRAVLTKQGQGHCKGVRQLLAAARRSTRSSQAGRRSPHRPEALSPRRERAVGGAWCGAGARGGCRPGLQGAAARKSYLCVIVRRTRTGGDPLALGEPALVAAICALRGARARAAVPARREAWPRRNGRRRGGAAVVAAAAGRGAASRGPRRGALTPHPAASQTPSCDSVSHWICPCASSCLPPRAPEPLAFP